jgi:hypothetical protein
MGVEEEFIKFQKSFEQVTLNLIASMSKISETLDRVSSAMELTAKIEIQNLENKQVLGNLEKQVRSLLTRLDKMSKGGFILPEAGAPATNAAASANLDALFNAPAKPSQATEEEPAPASIIKASPPPAPETEPIAVSETEPEIIPDPVPAPIPKVEVSRPLPPPPAPEPEMEVFEESPRPIPSLPKVASLKPLPSAPESSKLSPLPPAPSRNDSFASIPVHKMPSLPSSPAPITNPAPVNIKQATIASGWTRVENPVNPSDILTNLMVDIEAAGSIDAVGKLVLSTKDILAKKIPFSTSYFEMLMLAGPYTNAKGKPVTPDVIQKCLDKIKAWKASFH